VTEGGTRSALGWEIGYSVSGSESQRHLSLRSLTHSCLAGDLEQSSLSLSGVIVLEHCMRRVLGRDALTAESWQEELNHHLQRLGVVNLLILLAV